MSDFCALCGAIADLELAVVHWATPNAAGETYSTAPRCRDRAACLARQLDYGLGGQQALPRWRPDQDQRHGRQL